MKVVAACVVGVILMTLALWKRPDSEDDFRQFYRAAQLSASRQNVFGQPFLRPDKPTGVPDPQAVYLPFARVPSYAAMLRPLAWLPYVTARRVWLFTQFLAALACIWLIPADRNRLALAFAFSAPVAITMELGQDIFLVLLIALAAARIDSTGRRLSAGLMASLLAIKVTFLPAVGLIFLARSRRGTWGVALGVAIQLAVSFALQGGWVLDYLAVLRNPLFACEPRRMPNIFAVAASLGLPSSLFLIGSIALYLWLWRASKRLSFTDSLLIALPLGMLASFHGFLYDAVLLIPVAAVVASLDSWDGILASAALTPLPYLLMMTNSLPLMFAGNATLVAATIAALIRFRDMRAAPSHCSPLATTRPALSY